MGNPRSPTVRFEEEKDVPQHAWERRRPSRRPPTTTKSKSHKNTRAHPEQSLPASISSAPTSTHYVHDSNWKNMRKPHNVKPTASSHPSGARISDLCEEDRGKVAKLVHRIVEMGKMHEESAGQWHRDRKTLETEVQELRTYVETSHKEKDLLLSDLRNAKRKMRSFQERVQALEQSNNQEVRHRQTTHETVDMLKVEVGKLRDLVRKQRSAMDAKVKEAQQKYVKSAEKLRQQLEQAQEELEQERQLRQQEKQQPIEPHEASGGTDTYLSRYKEMSSTWSTTQEIPESVRDFVHEWKQRADAAIAEARQQPPDRLETSMMSLDRTAIAPYERKEDSPQMSGLDGHNGSGGSSLSFQDDFGGGDWYESTLFDMVDDLDESNQEEEEKSRSVSRDSHDQSLRLEKLRSDLQAREDRLAKLRDEYENSCRKSVTDDVALFNEIKDVYGEDIAQQQHEVRRKHRARVQSGEIGPPMTAQELSMQEEMREMLQEPSFRQFLR